MSMPHSIHLGFLLYYITLTDYYILKDTFRWQVITAIVEKENNKVNKM